jgi:hypothetical protein
MIPNDTLLAKFVRNFGEETLKFLVENLYPSPAFKLILFSAGLFMLCMTALSLHQGRAHKYILVFWLAWIMAVPIGNRPLFYVFTNNLSVLVSMQLQKTTYNLFTHFGGKKTYPPGFVSETLIQASTSKITDPGISKAVSVVIKNCVPFGEIKGVNGDNRPINASDLFRVQIDGSIIGGTSKLVFPFDTSMLLNRKIKHDGEVSNCKEVLETTIARLYAHLHGKGLAVANNQLYVGAASGDLPSKWIDKWSASDYRQTRLGKTAINLAAASAVQAQILNDYFGIDLDYRDNKYLDHNTSPLIAMQKKLLGQANPTSMLYNVRNLPNDIMRKFNIDHFLDNSSNLLDLNKKLQNMPYYISSIQVFLKIILPLVVFTPFLIGTFRLLNMWAIAYFLSLLVPWVMMISRSVCNVILLHALNIEKTVDTYSTDPSYLKLGIDFTAASNILDDTGRFLSTYVETENALWASMAMIIPIVSWFGSGARNSTGPSFIERATGFAGNGLIAKGMGRGASVLGGKMALKFIPAAMALGGVARGLKYRSGLSGGNGFNNANTNHLKNIKDKL